MNAPLDSRITLLAAWGAAVVWFSLLDGVRGHSQLTSEERGREGVAQILTQ